MEWIFELGLSASLLAGRTTRVPQGCPLVRGICSLSNTRTLRLLMAFSSSRTSPLLAACKASIWVQCRSLSLTLFGFYSKMDITPYFLASQKIRPVGVRKNGMVDNDPIICVTCHHYAVLSQSWGGNNQGGPGINFHPNPSSSHLLVLSIVEIKLASLRYSFICL